jgi:hypothetical protein
VAQSPNDRRKHARQRKLLKLTIESIGRKFDAVTTDLGPGGAFIKCKQPLNIGKQVRVQFTTGRKSKVLIEAIARVTRQVEKAGPDGPVPGYGINWVRVSCEGDRKKLQELMYRFFIDPRRLPIPGGYDFAPPDSPTEGGAKAKASTANSAPPARHRLPNRNVVKTVTDGSTVVAENSWQATRLKALQDARIDETEVGATDPRTIPEVPFTRRTAQMGAGPATRSSQGQGKAPSNDTPGQTAQETTGLQDAGPESGQQWKDVPTLRLDDIEPFDAPAAMEPELSLEELYSLGVSLNIPVTYRVRSMFFVGHLKMVSHQMLYIQTKRRPPTAGERVLVNIPVKYGTRSQFITLVTRVNYVDMPKDDEAGGFESSISNIDERGNGGAFRAFLKSHGEKMLSKSSKA